MKIVIVGNGKVGFALAKQLDQEGHDLTIIDNKQRVLENTLNILDVEGFVGNGADYDVLKNANVEKADILIAVTSLDEINILSCLLAKKLGTKNTIARIREPEFGKSAFALKDELGLSMQINPERGAAREIIRSLRYSNSIKTSSFAKGRIEISQFKVSSNNPLIGMKVMDISKKYGSILLCTILRNDEVIIPYGNDIIEKNDKISVTGSTKNIENFFLDMGVINRRAVNEVLIVGGGRISYYLTQMLVDIGIHVKLIEQDYDKCVHLAEIFPDVTVIYGDGTDHEFLQSENIAQMDAFVALTGNDEENVIVSMYAASCGVEHVIPKVNRLTIDFLLEKVGLENVVQPKISTANRIVQYVRAMQNTVGSNVESLIKLNNGDVEALEFRVRENCKFIGIPLKDLQLKKDILVCYITHKGKPRIARGDSKAEIGDTMIIISKVTGLRDINDVLD